MTAPGDKDRRGSTMKLLDEIETRVALQIWISRNNVYQHGAEAGSY